MQRTDEWTKNYNPEYFDRQFKEPYRSTVAFCDWIEKLSVIDNTSPLNVLDVGTGKGANIHYLTKRFSQARFTGIDINEEFVKEGNDILTAEGLSDKNILEVADLYNLDKKYVDSFQGLISFQTLSWLPDYKDALDALVGLNPDWIGLTSLFFDGDVNCKIEVEEFTNSIDNESKKTFYNIYSLPLIERFFSNHGYKKFQYIPFEIDTDLPKPNHKIMGTYTEKLENGIRIQRSGPLLMSWYFILARR